MSQDGELETLPWEEGEPCAPTTPQGDVEALLRLQQGVASGEQWYLALLDAVALWESAEEVYRGRHYRYLIGGEAFDWLLLAERLIAAVDGLVPEEEKLALLFHGRPPIAFDAEEFRRRIGKAKHRAHLNYLYGVTVEETLLLAVEEEVRKERQGLPASGDGSILDAAYLRVYGAPQEVLFREFREEKGYPQGDTISFEELREFTYWLFKYRVTHSDPARVASDTRKGLEKLRQLWQTHGEPSQIPAEETQDLIDL